MMMDDDDEDDAGLSSGAGTNLKVGGTCQARGAGNLFGRALHFFGFTSTIVVVLVSTSVWSVQFDHFLVFLFFLLSVPPYPVICKSVGTCPRALDGVSDSASLSCYSFTRESITKQPFNLNA